jgi:hypothetical protein
VTGEPNQNVLIGIQLEDGPRLERRVRIDISEHGLKLLVWNELRRPWATHHLHIRNAQDESVEEYRISCQWAYILRKKPPAYSKTGRASEALTMRRETRRTRSGEAAGKRREAAEVTPRR